MATGPRQMAVAITWYADPNGPQATSFHLYQGTPTISYSSAVQTLAGFEPGQRHILRSSRV